MNPNAISTQTFEELANSITELEKSLREQLTAKEAVDIERNKIATDIIVLKLKDHDLKDAQIKAGANLKRLMIDHSQLKRLYWEKKA